MSSNDAVFAEALGMGFPEEKIKTAMAMCEPKYDLETVISTLLQLDASDSQRLPSPAKPPATTPVLSLTRSANASVLPLKQPAAAVPTTSAPKYTPTPGEISKRDARQKQREQEATSRAERIKEEKRIQREERQRVLKDIEENNAERRKKKSVATAPATPVVAASSTRVPTNDTGAKVQIRLPDGSAVVKEFRGDEKLLVVMEAAKDAILNPDNSTFVGEANDEARVQNRLTQLQNQGGAFRLGGGPEGADSGGSVAEQGRAAFLQQTEKLMREAAQLRSSAPNTLAAVEPADLNGMKLIIPFPRREFSGADLENVRLGDAGLVPCGTVVVQREEDEGTLQQGTRQSLHHRYGDDDDDDDDDDDETYEPSEGGDDDDDDDDDDSHDDDDCDDHRSNNARVGKKRAHDLSGGQVLGAAGNAPVSRLLNLGASGVSTSGSQVTSSPVTRERKLSYNKNRERERLRKEIARDREDRQKKLPHANAPPSLPQQASPSSARSMPNFSTIVVRFANGHECRQSFKGDDSLWDVHRFVINSTDALNIVGDFYLYMPLPRRDFTDESEMKATQLASVGLVPGGVLCVGSIANRPVFVVDEDDPVSGVPQEGSDDEDAGKVDPMDCKEPCVRSALSAGMAEVQVRLADGRILSSQFAATDCFDMVQRFVAESCEISFDSFSLFTPLPRREFCYRAVMGESLERLGMVPGVLLHVNHRPLTDDAPEGILSTLLIAPKPTQKSKEKKPARAYPQAWKSRSSADDDDQSLTPEQRRERQSTRMKELRRLERAERTRIRLEFESDQMERRKKNRPTETPCETAGTSMAVTETQPASTGQLGPVQIRCPDGSTIILNMSADQTLVDVRNQLVSDHLSEIPSEAFNFVTIAPRQQFTFDEEVTARLGGIGAVPGGTLVLQRLEENGTVREGRTFNHRANRWRFDENNDDYEDDGVNPDEMSYEELLAMTSSRDVRRGLSRLEIENIPSSKFTPSDHGKGEDRCSICCYEFVENESVKTLKCSHTFHSFCIARWLVTSCYCPLCKQAA